MATCAGFYTAIMQCSRACIHPIILLLAMKCQKGDFQLLFYRKQIWFGGESDWMRVKATLETAEVSSTEQL